MRTSWLIGAMAAGMAARAFGAAQEVTVYACSDPGVPLPILQRAEVVADGLFARVGISVRWRAGRPKTSVVGRATEELAIRLEAGIPTGPHARALAFAAPEQDGVIIHVFYSNVSAVYRPDMVHVLLGYVLAHEIGHVLEGASRHSQQGIMKAFWTVEDYREMAAGRLAFAPADVTTILKRLAVAEAEAEQAHSQAKRP